MIGTFNALLLIARAEVGAARDHLDEFDAAEVAQGSANSTSRWPKRKAYLLKSTRPEVTPVHGNRELVSQALANLVDNAIKYAPSKAGPNGPQPEIIVRAAAGEGDRILLTVSDNGPGIPEADRGRAVERFVRLEQSRSQAGSGLGLSLANAVAHLHGGELKLEDNHPGLRCVISLPRGGPAAAIALSK